jgi:hypothetical protein
MTGKQIYDILEKEYYTALNKSSIDRKGKRWEKYM